jgi:hypothetical protein
LNTLAGRSITEATFMTSTELSKHDASLTTPTASHTPGAPSFLKFHNRLIYHCLACGNVIHREPDDIVPVCCGSSMTPAAAESVFDADLPPAV